MTLDLGEFFWMMIALTALAKLIRIAKALESISRSMP